eukprot:CAMPEP_0203760512 /NCGR_PEP_ID=MMETSP0098-20131031/13781_1 /ASSEMBLY_ACC=CAM_ASM_000208 /TAXON_ID=96639 /ORGANISM=" , Strain NY0313808BC1" /LENGTH=407 /DNA_ID=CAMNT_0050654095 /DNA_START=154 /DNA_END=1377 /DNA_ORIENTATION=+
MSQALVVNDDNWKERLVQYANSEIVPGLMYHRANWPGLIRKWVVQLLQQQGVGLADGFKMCLQANAIKQPKSLCSLFVQSFESAQMGPICAPFVATGQVALDLQTEAPMRSVLTFFSIDENDRLTKSKAKKYEKEHSVVPKVGNKKPRIEGKKEKVKEGLPVPAELLEDQSSSNFALPELEIEHVQKVYNQVASQWHGTRYKSWPKVAAFINSLHKGSFIGDIGCGNGKNLPACNSVGYGIGCDFSSSLVDISAGQGFEAFVADNLHLPFRDGIFDAVLSIAVLHHISSEARRVRLVSETMRIVKPGGRGLFYAWAQEQDDGVSRHVFGEQDVLVPFHARKDKTKREQAEQVSHAREDSSKNAFVFQRYCHVYVKGELEGLFACLDDCVVVDSYYDCGNWCVVVEKT